MVVSYEEVTIIPTYADIEGLQLKDLGLRTRQYERLTQTGQVIYRDRTGIRSVEELLRCQPGNLLKLYPFNIRDLLRVMTILRYRGWRLAYSDIAPCLVAPDGDEWVCIPRITSEPSWQLHSMLPELSLARLIRIPAKALNKYMKIETVGDLAGKTRQDIFMGVNWSSRNMDGDEVVDRINTALVELGLEPLR